MPGLQRSTFTTNDPEAAREAFAPIVPRLEFARVDRDTFGLVMRTESAPGFSVFDYAFTTAADVDAEADDVVVVSGRGRGFELRHGRRAVDASRPYVNATEGITADWESFAARAVVLDRSRLEEVAAMTYGEPVLRLQPIELPARSAELGRRWESTVQTVKRAIAGAPEAFDEPLIAEAAFHRLAVAYLHAFDLGVPGVTGGLVRPGARSAVVRAALEVMHARAHTPLTVQHVAQAVHISVRGLHSAFVSETGRPPSEHLRAIRLAGVRDELRFADPAERVGAIARRWGFVHLSRFAEAYEREYGELPSATRYRRGLAA
ncbi:helix-turn-helix transcriptional regulator [Agromyces aurantiacus]|uniref:Helix-turn-helix transcriptional regulator n=1 Tax=Agromyces aurantiacus TaxID=165814 RepID=A0ABV9R5A5_9MICO|nr:helix-turn-helix transcriptional regulator [Agromyces aurantiacus]MBM7505811.1 AraC-like DNA-binding protein [Agromyces aurantiacus]